MRYALLLLFTFSLLLNACDRKRHNVTRGFYYWRTGYSMSEYEAKRLQEAQCKALYLRCFDVAWDEVASRPKPLAVLHFNAFPDKRFSYTPVVFITQQVVAKMTPKQVPELAANIAKLLGQIIHDNKLHAQEIQIDCDWTRGTQATYFELLKALKSQPLFTVKSLSCTIRLHQVKFKIRSGIPPVDKGLLMCYNVGNLKQPGAHNSILDEGLVKDYLKDVKTYPLKLDVALPLFGWCVQFHDGKMIGILRDISPESIDRVAFFKPVKGNLYGCVQDTNWNGYSFHSGDQIRVEVPTLDAINNVAAFTAEQINNDSLSVLFFHADSLILTHYTQHELETIYNHYN